MPRKPFFFLCGVPNQTEAYIIWTYLSGMCQSSDGSRPKVGCRLVLSSHPALRIVVTSIRSDACASLKTSGQRNTVQLQKKNKPYVLRLLQPGIRFEVSV